MKRLFCSVIAAGMMFAASANAACWVTYVDLTSALKQELYDRKQFDDLDRFEELYPIEEIGYIYKVRAINQVTKGHPMKLISGSIHYDPVIYIEICSDNGYEMTEVK